MTIQQMAAQLITEAAEALERNLAAMPADRQDWSAGRPGRTALEVVRECATTNHFLAQLLTQRGMPGAGGGAPVPPGECATPEQVLELLRAGRDALVAAVSAFPDEHLQDTVTLPFGGGMTLSFAQVMFKSYWHMTYHEGQVNYIQTLYGDTDWH